MKTLGLILLGFGLVCYIVWDIYVHNSEHKQDHKENKKCNCGHKH
jgi:hypothetical protein